MDDMWATLHYRLGVSRQNDYERIDLTGAAFTYKDQLWGRVEGDYQGIFPVHESWLACGEYTSLAFVRGLHTVLTFDSRERWSILNHADGKPGKYVIVERIL